MPRTRVLIAHCFYRVPGGEDRYVRQQLELLSDDHDVELLERVNEDLSHSLRTAVDMVIGPRIVDDVERRIHGFRPDVVHLHNPYPALGPAVHLASQRAGVPVIQTVHNLRFRCPNGVMFTEGRSCHRCEGGNYANAIVHKCFPSRSQAAGYATALWSHRFVLRLERRVASFVAPSAFLADRLQTWGIAPERVTTIRNFVRPSDAAPTAATSDVGVYVGRLSPEKGLDVLLRALRLAGDPPFRIIGEGPMGASLRRGAKELRLRRTVFTGQLGSDDVSAEMREAGYLVMPSVCDENAPLAALEAMALARPIAVSRRGGLPELVDGERGVSFSSGDAVALAGAIRSLGEDASRRMRLGENALRFAQTHLSPVVHRDALSALYIGVRDRSRRA